MPYRYATLFLLSFPYVQLSHKSCVLFKDYKKMPATPIAAPKTNAISPEYQVDGLAAPFWRVALSVCCGSSEDSSEVGTGAPTVAKDVTVDWDPFGRVVVR